MSGGCLILTQNFFLQTLRFLSCEAAASTKGNLTDSQTDLLTRSLTRQLAILTYIDLI